MSGISEQRKQMESAFMNDFWKLRKEEGSAESDNNDYWDRIYRKVNDLGQKYDMDDYVCDMLMAFVNDLERQIRPRQLRHFQINLLNVFRSQKGLPPVAEVQQNVKQG